MVALCSLLLSVGAVPFTMADVVSSTRQSQQYGGQGNASSRPCTCRGAETFARTNVGGSAPHCAPQTGYAVVQDRQATQLQDPSRSSLLERRRRQQQQQQQRMRAAEAGQDRASSGVSMDINRDCKQRLLDEVVSEAVSAVQSIFRFDSNSTAWSRPLVEPVSTVAPPNTPCTSSSAAGCTVAPSTGESVFSFDFATADAQPIEPCSSSQRVLKSGPRRKKSNSLCLLASSSSSCSPAVAAPGSGVKARLRESRVGKRYSSSQSTPSSPLFHTQHVASAPLSARAHAVRAVQRPRAVAPLPSNDDDEADDELSSADDDDDKDCDDVAGSKLCCRVQRDSAAKQSCTESEDGRQVSTDSLALRLQVLQATHDAFDAMDERQRGESANTDWHQLGADLRHIADNLICADGPAAADRVEGVGRVGGVQGAAQHAMADSLLQTVNSVLPFSVPTPIWTALISYGMYKLFKHHV